MAQAADLVVLSAAVPYAAVERADAQEVARGRLGQGHAVLEAGWPARRRARVPYALQLEEAVLLA